MASSNTSVPSALSYLDRHTPEFLKTLVALSRIPSVSASGYPPAEVRRSAVAVADALRAAAGEHVPILEVPDAHPHGYGDWLPKPGAPPILLYGHPDAQPEAPPPQGTSPPLC